MAPQIILVVDDIAEQREIYTALLRHHRYRVLEASGGEEALRLAREERPTMILLDMMMAAPDGWAVTEELKDDPETAQIPIVALTVQHSEEAQERARKAGVEAYLIKPCAPTAMLEEVRRFIGAAAEPHTS